MIAWVTVWSRGSSAPIAFAIAVLAAGNLFGKTGWAVWFPWSIVPLLIGMVSDPLAMLPVGGSREGSGRNRRRSLRRARAIIDPSVPGA